MDTSEWYDLGTYFTLIGGFFSLLATSTLDPLLQYRYDSFNLLQYVLFVLITASVALIILKILTGIQTWKDGLNDGKKVLNMLTGKIDEEVDQLVIKSMTKIKTDALKTATSFYHTQKDRIQAKLTAQAYAKRKTPVQNVNLARVQFPTPSQLYTEVRRKFQTQILAVNLEQSHLVEQSLVIVSPELDSSEGLEPVDRYQQRSRWTFFSILALMVIVNVIVRFLPPSVV